MKQQRLQLLLIRLAEKKRFFLNKLPFVEQEVVTLQLYFINDVRLQAGAESGHLLQFARNPFTRLSLLFQSLHLRRLFNTKKNTINPYQDRTGAWPWLASTRGYGPHCSGYPKLIFGNSVCPNPRGPKYILPFRGVTYPGRVLLAKGLHIYTYIYIYMLQPDFAKSQL